MKNKKQISKIIITFLLVTFILAFPLASRSWAQNNIIAGVYLEDIDLSKKTYEEAYELINESFSSLLFTEITFNFNEKTYTTNLENLGVEFDVFSTVENAYQVSFGKNIIEHIQNKTLGYVNGLNVKPVFDVNKNILEKEIINLIPEISSPNDANIIVTKDFKISVINHKDGLTTDFEKVTENLKNEIKYMSVPSNIKLKRIEIPAIYSKDKAQLDAEMLRSFLGKKITFLYLEDNETQFEKEITLPVNWVEVKNQELIINERAIEKFLHSQISPHMNIHKENARIYELPKEGAKYAKVNGIVRDGRKLNVEKTKEKIIEAIQRHFIMNRVFLEVDYEKGLVVNDTEKDLGGEFELLAVGRSDFATSPAGRIFNIDKGLTEKVNNIFLQPNEIYSFNSTLGPVTGRYGWRSALTIFRGRDLISVPGGGLCQVSTTVYRAALEAGLEIIERAPHSLYIHYYKAYGDGLDATIYPGSRDLRFRNNTGSPILMQAWTEGEDAFVKFYGISDGRKVELIGPFYTNRAPEDAPEYLKNSIRPRWNQIIWVQRITDSDGTVEEKQILSSYSTAPR